MGKYTEREIFLLMLEWQLMLHHLKVVVTKVAEAVIVAVAEIAEVAEVVTEAEADQITLADSVHKETPMRGSI
jgi:hypothetical protein